MSLGYDEDAATTMITLAGDFGITQIVDGNWGVHVNIPKYILNGSQTGAYTQSVTCGGSIPATSAPASPAAFTVTSYLAANSSTVHWGFYSKTLQPVLTVASGSVVTVEMLSHHAGDYFDGMIKGDPGVLDVYQMGSGSTVQDPVNGTLTTRPINFAGNTFGTYMRGASGGGDGVHILTGPIAVTGAVPGDIIQVDVLSLRPRVNPATNKTFGINAAAWWGYHYGVNSPLGRGSSAFNGWSNSPTSFPDAHSLGYMTGDPDREMTNVYQLITDASGKGLYAQPTFRFKYGVPGSVLVPCVGGPIQPIVGFSPGVSVPCVGGFQNFTGYQFPGLITQHPTGTEDYSVAGAWQIPLNYHVGSMGLAPASPAFVNSIPPMVGGGNLDNRRLGVGATMYLKVAVNGGLLSMGDAHMAQGDSELDGTGIETHITGDFRLTLIKQGSASASGVPAGILSNLNYPLIENANEFVVHGFTYTDYLTSLGYTNTSCNGTAIGGVSLGANSTYSPLGCPLGGTTSQIFFQSRTDDAVANAVHQAKSFVMGWSPTFTEDNAISMLTVACDFALTQIVDGNFGAHVTIPKYLLSNQSAPYVQQTMCKTSTPAASYVASTITG
jgi:acetamidase/formamidase